MATVFVDGLQQLLGDVARAVSSVSDPIVVSTLGGVLAIVLAFRALAIRAALRKRICWAALAADEFDPQPEDISRFAFQLVRVRRAVRGWFERPAAAVRIRLESVPEGQMLYVVECPQHARSVLRAAVYDRVDLRDIDSLDLEALSLRPDLPDGEESTAPAGRPARGEPAEPALDDPREDVENDWIKEDRW